MTDARFKSGIRGVSPDELPVKLRAAIEKIAADFPNDTGIALFVFDRGAAPGGMAYIANVKREDMIAALVEFIQRQRGQN